MKKLLLAIGVIAALVGVGTTLTTQAADYTTRNCTGSAIIKCGAFNQTELNKGLTGDVKAVFSHYGIGTNLSAAKSGTLTTDGRVVVNGKTVATGAETVGRIQRSGSKAVNISGKTYYQHSVSTAFPGDTPVFVFFDQFGRYTGAIAKICGNPIVATPTQPKPSVTCDQLVPKAITRTKYEFTTKATAKDGASITGYSYNFGDGTVKTGGATITHEYAKPGTYTVTVTVKSNIGDTTSEKCKTTVTVKPAPAADCTTLVATIKNRDQFTLTATASTSNGATISSYVFSIVDASNTTVFSETVASSAQTATVRGSLAQDGTYTAKVVVKTSVGDKTNSKCETRIVVTPEPTIDVCELKTKKVITIKETDFDKTKHSKDLSDCDDVLIEVCELATKDIITINEDDFDSAQHSRNLSDCDDVPVVPKPETPAELPTTGPAEVVLSGLGVGSVVAATGYYAASRRSLLSAFLNR